MTGLAPLADSTITFEPNGWSIENYLCVDNLRMRAHSGKPNGWALLPLAPRASNLLFFLYEPHSLGKTMLVELELKPRLWSKTASFRRNRVNSWRNRVHLSCNCPVHAQDSLSVTGIETFVCYNYCLRAPHWQQIATKANLGQEANLAV